MTVFFTFTKLGLLEYGKLQEGQQIEATKQP
jgi:hypothetical protein